MLYFLKRTTSFLKFDIVFFQEYKCGGFFCLFFFLLLNIALIFYRQNSTAIGLLFCVDIVFILLCFAFTFSHLRKQNFFNFFVLNRSFFNLKLEVLSFLVSLCCPFWVITLIFLPFIENQIWLLVVLSIFFCILDALFFVVSSLKIYIALKIPLLPLFCLLLFSPQVSLVANLHWFILIFASEFLLSCKFLIKKTAS